MEQIDYDVDEFMDYFKKIKDIKLPKNVKNSMCSYRYTYWIQMTTPN